MTWETLQQLIASNGKKIETFENSIADPEILSIFINIVSQYTNRFFSMDYTKPSFYIKNLQRHPGQMLK